MLALLQRTAATATLYLAMSLLFALMALTFFEVIGRYLVGTPIQGKDELTRMFLLMIVFLAFPLTTMRGEHVTVDLLDGLFGRRGATIRDIIVKLLCSGMLFVSLPYIFLQVERAYSRNNIFETLTRLLREYQGLDAFSFRMDGWGIFEWPFLAFLLASIALTGVLLLVAAIAELVQWLAFGRTVDAHGTSAGTEFPHDEDPVYGSHAADDAQPATASDGVTIDKP